MQALIELEQDPIGGAERRRSHVEGRGGHRRTRCALRREAERALTVLRDAEFHRRHYEDVVGARAREALAAGASYRRVAEALHLSVGAVHARYGPAA